MCAATGWGHTRNGTPIDIFDHFGVQRDEPNRRRVLPHRRRLHRLGRTDPGMLVARWLLHEGQHIEGIVEIFDELCGSI